MQGWLKGNRDLKKQDLLYDNYSKVWDGNNGGSEMIYKGQSWKVIEKESEGIWGLII